MRTPFLLLLFLLAAAPCCAQTVVNPTSYPSDSPYRKEKKIVLHAVQEKGDCVFGLKNETGEWVVQPQYHSIAPAGGYSFTRYWIVSREGLLYGLLDSTGKEIFAPKYRDLKYVYAGARPYFSYSGELNKTGVVDVNGNVIVNAEYDKLDHIDYNYTLFYMERNDSLAVVSSTGKLIVPLREGYISPFRYGKAIVDTTIYIPLENTKKEKKKKPDYYYRFGCIDTSGKTVLPVAYAGILCVSRYLVPVKRDSLWGLVNWHNEIVFPFEAQRMDVYNKDSLIRVKLNGKQGLFDQWGGWLIPPEYDSIAYSNRRNIIPLLQNGKWIFADSSGRIMDRAPLDELLPFAGPERYSIKYVTIAKAGGKYGVLDDSINWIYQPRADYMGWHYKSPYYEQRDTLWTYEDGPGAKVRLYVLRNEYKTRYVWNHRKHENERIGYYQYRFDSIPIAAIAKSPVLIFRGSNFHLAARADGTLLIPPQPYELSKTVGSDFSIKGPKGKGIINDSGKIIVPPVMREAGRLSTFFTPSERLTAYLDSDPFYYVRTMSGNYGAYDAGGKRVLDTLYDIILQARTSPDPGFWLTRNARTEEWELVYANGQTRRWNEFLTRSGSCIIARNGNRTVLYHLDHLDKPVVTLRRQYLNASGKNHFEIWKSWRKKGLMDANGKIILPLSYSDVTNIGENLWWVRDRRSNGLCDSNGVWLSGVGETDFYLRHIRLDSLFTGMPYYDTFCPAKLKGDTTAPVLPGTIRRSHRQGYYELLDADNRHPYKQLINDFLSELRLEEAHYSYPAARKISLNDRSDSYRYAEAYNFKDHQLVALTGSTFTVRNPETYFIGGSLYEQKETYDNYYIEANEIQRFLVNEVFLPENRGRLVNLLTQELKKKTNDAFVYDCGRPGSISCDDFCVKAEGIDFLFVNKSKEIAYSLQRNERANTVVIFLSYEQLKPLIDPEGPLKTLLFSGK